MKYWSDVQCSKGVVQMLKHSDSGFTVPCSYISINSEYLNLAKTHNRLPNDKVRHDITEIPSYAMYVHREERWCMEKTHTAG